MKALNGLLDREIQTKINMVVMHGKNTHEVVAMARLSEKMNMSPVNLAMPGGGNDRIVRTTINYCLSNKVDFVIIGST